MIPLVANLAFNNLKSTILSIDQAFSSLDNHAATITAAHPLPQLRRPDSRRSRFLLGKVQRLLSGKNKEGKKANDVLLHRCNRRDHRHWPHQFDCVIARCYSSNSPHRKSKILSYSVNCIDKFANTNGLFHIMYPDDVRSIDHRDSS